MFDIGTDFGKFLRGGGNDLTGGAFVEGMATDGVHQQGQKASIPKSIKDHPFFGSLAGLDLQGGDLRLGGFQPQLQGLLTGHIGNGQHIGLGIPFGIVDMQQ